MKEKTINLIVVLILSIISLKAQKEANHWYFGANAGLDFSTGSPQFDSSSFAPSSMGCATVSDSAGNLLFYTNGGDESFLSYNWTGVVVNRNHQIMPNGYLRDSCETGGNFQSSLIIPKVGSTFEYYLFTIDGFNRGQNKGLKYSIIDMNKDSSLGDVTVKGIFIEDSLTNGMAATKHSNGTDYWLILRKVTTNLLGSFKYYAYKIDSNGINQPIISPQHINNSLSNTCKFSPNGEYFYSGMGIYDFNKQNGNISNFRPFRTYFPYSTAEFSMNNKVVYAYNMGSSAFEIDQFDLTSSNLTATKYVVDSMLPSGIKGAMQLGSDGKIYISHVGSHFLSVIESPDSLGAACNYRRNRISLAGRPAWWEFPNFPSSYFYKPPVTVNLNKKSINSKVAIYPNPVSNTLIVDGFNKFNQFSIHNVMGIITLNGDAQDRIDVSHLENGIYFLRLFGEDGTFEQKKFIKSN